MLSINYSLSPSDFRGRLKTFWEISGKKIVSLERNYPQSAGAPVFTAAGRYIGRGWTDWTRGFQCGSALLQYEATGEPYFLELGRKSTLAYMPAHLTHFGVHDHGFNIVSSYGNLFRLMRENRIPYNADEENYYTTALKVSAAVQAHRWTKIAGGGFIYSFNGPHSLFIDTIRSCRSLVIGHLLDHVLFEENDKPVSLLERTVQHLQTTAEYAVYYGEGRDLYDVRGRTAHESLFNITDGSYRCPSTQQGYSPFSTWMRGLAWAMLGFAEELEIFAEMNWFDTEERKAFEAVMRRAASAACDFYIENTPVDGIPYWDTGAPNLHKLGDYLNRPADPFNDYEPVDSSAACIAAQGLMRFGAYSASRHSDSSEKYFQAGLTILAALLDEPYFCRDENHQGLVLHSVYHRPKGWDYIPPGKKIPCGEASMWGDYHAREAALLLQRLVNQDVYYVFWR